MQALTRALDRRAAIQLTAATSGATLLASCGQCSERPLRIIDANVHLSMWPFRRLPLDHIDKLAAKLKSLGIQQAWAGSYEALLHRDLRAVNARLAALTASAGRFVPMGALNPRLPDWREDFRVCVDVHKMRGIRIYPNYHQYSLDSPEFLELLTLCGRQGVLLQVAVAMEDIRTQHPSVRVTDVDLRPLSRILPKVSASVQLLNYRPRAAELASLSKLPRLYFDTARVDSTDSVPALVRAAPDRILFGSHAPLLIPEAALIRVHESDQLSTEQLRAVYSANAEALLRTATASSNRAGREGDK